MKSRRTFLKQGGAAGGLLILGAFPFSSLAKQEVINVTILHSNDTQSQIEPFGAGVPKFEGMGGIQARADLIKKIRAEQEHVLLFDSGDYFQGNPNFDAFGGEVEIKAMNLMGYDAAGVGIHEFDGGIENFTKQISKANFPVVCSNYDITKTSLSKAILPYTIIIKAGIKFGVLGVGAKLKDVLSGEISNQIGYLDPIKKANETASHLKNKENCDFIICLSQLGLSDFNSNSINDKTLAKESENIDLIIGGNSHTLLQKPLKYFNKKKSEVLIVQAGWGGTHLGRINYAFSTKKNILSSNAQTVEIAK